MESALALLKCLDRLTQRMGAKSKWSSEGIFLSSKDPIESEFLVGQSFFRGMGLLPGQSALRWREEAKAPYFLLTFGEELAAEESRKGMKPLAELNLWEKTLQPQSGNSPLHLKRVENVPTINAYRSLDSWRDPLFGGAMDVFTQWFLAYPSENATEPTGKLRLTDGENGIFFLSQLFGKNPETIPSLWEATEDYLGQFRPEAKALLLLAPKANAIPETKGFKICTNLHVHGAF